MQNKGLLIGAGIFIAAALVGGYFILFRNQTKPSYLPAANQPTIQSEGTPATGAVKEVTVKGNEYSFSPKSLSLTKGEAVKLTFENIGKLPHNITVNELGVSTKTIPGGSSDTVEFTVSKSGTFSFYCSVGSHRSLGMEGEMEVK